MGKRNCLGKILDDRGISARHLERLSGVGHSTINRIINGETDPTQTTMILIAKGLHLKVTDIFDFSY